MRILVIAPAWVGDMVMAHTLVQLLEDAEVDVLAPPATAPLGARMPGVRHVHVLEVGHGELGIKRRWRMGRALRGYDQAIVLPNTIKSALVPAFAGIARRTGWVGESRYGLLNDIRRLDKTTHPLMIERFMALGLPKCMPLPTPYPKPELEPDQANAKRLMNQLELGDDKPVAVLCPGAEFGPAKRWPARHYAKVARHLLAQGKQVWLMGSPKDLADCQNIQAEVADGDLHVLAGKTSLLDAIDLIAQAEVVVCNDSGLMHVAAALGVSVVAVYGSTSTEFTPPLGDDAQVVRLGLDCSPCFQRQCPLGHLNCLNDLTPERVIACL